jgi:hypothetical protein
VGVGRHDLHFLDAVGPEEDAEDQAVQIHIPGGSWVARMTRDCAMRGDSVNEIPF